MEATETPLEGKSPIIAEKWQYEITRQYLIGLSRGPDFVLPEEQFPKEIELSSDWHEVLNKMRSDTSGDVLERWAAIGYKTNSFNQRSIFLPNLPAVGKYHQVPSDVISQERTRMSKSAGLDRVVGDIHSHPRKLNRRIPARLLRLMNQPSFSVGDLYNLVHRSTEVYLMGLVDGVDNLFAFRTRQSEPEMVNRRLLSQSSFERYWYENNGWKYLGRENDRWPYASPASKSPTSALDLAKKIVARHHLVMYKGLENRNLVRVHS